MCFIRNGGALCSNHRLGCDLGKCFQRLTIGQRYCIPGGDCPANFQPDCPNNSPNGISEKTKWMWRNRVYIPEKRNREFRGLSHKDYWDVIFEFLYSLTLQNFGKVLNPQGHAWNSCRVPLSNFDTCDYYMGIFDCDGNLRNPYHPEALLKLLSVMQLMLKGERKEDKGARPKIVDSNSIPEINPKRKSPAFNRRIANKAGIGPDSLARANGRRRRFRMGEKYRLEGPRGEVNPLFAQSTWNCYSRRFARIFGPIANKLGTSEGSKSSTNLQVVSKGTKVFCETDSPLEKREERATNQEKKRELDKLLYGENGEFASDGGEFEDCLRRRELMNLIQSVKQKTSIQKDVNSLIDAVKNLDLKMAVKNDGALAKGISHRLSTDYYRMAARNNLNTKSQIPNNEIGRTGFLEPAELENRLPSVNRELFDQTSSGKKTSIGVPDEQSNRARYFYGAQVPILLHEPFDRTKPKTWIRRHPKASRMNERDEIVEEGVIHRYKRQTVRGQLDNARRDVSVHTVYSSDGAISSPKPLSEPKKAPKRKIQKKPY
ncbi:uncharacterized protein LOC117780613 [Drosophila innubila]|uniref:uncharacterized protein LOC117780613 n=1 Tax=Drosophila innubila TaxID=198719 RepID=UPI00148C3749|nr:uncharacterized protein LOC117780613 [Drosophila innubila]